jgi:hypothetical protein
VRPCSRTASAAVAPIAAANSPRISSLITQAEMSTSHSTFKTANQTSQPLIRHLSRGAPLFIAAGF